MDWDDRDAEAEDEDDELDFRVFPYIMLNERALIVKLTTLRHTIHTWHELVMMLDQNNSGSLGAMELQYSIMAFASMGMITEALEYQPADQRSIPKKDRIERFEKGWMGWTKTDSGPNKWRQPFEFKEKVGDNIKDFPIYIAPGEALLMGKEGIPVLQHPWILQVDFQFDSNCQKNRGKDREGRAVSSNFNILVSSYRNNTIVARKCGKKDDPQGRGEGIQLLFIKKDAFLDAAEMMEKCEEYATAGRDDYEYTKEAVPYPTGHTFEVTPFIPMEHLRWYRLTIQGDKWSRS